MPYGSIKVDNIIFTNSGADQTTTVSGLYAAITSGVTVSGTISGTTIQGQTISGVTVTGTTANFTSGVFTTQISGATVTGTTANFTSGNFTALSGASTTVTSGIFAIGSAAAPSISFASDPNTGIYSPGADQVALATNGTQRLTVDTAATTSTLPVVHPLGAVGTPSITFTGDLNTGLWSPSADALAASTAGSERLRITSAGLVGIGTNSPGAALDVSSTTGTRIRSSYTNTTGARDAGFEIYADLSGSFAARASFTYLGNLGIASLTSALELAVSTNSLERLRITSAGLVGIGTTSPGLPLQVIGTIGTAPASTNSGFLLLSGNSGAAAGCTIESSFTSGGYGPLLFKVNNGEAARIDSSGRLLVGTSSALSSPYWLALAKLQVTGEYGAGHFASFVNSSAGAGLIFQKSRSATVGGNTIVNNGDSLMDIAIEGNDGTGFVRAAAIQCSVDGTPGANDMPGRLVFSTTADGASSPTERLRISNAGTTTLTSAASTAPFIANISASEVARIDSSGRLLVGTSSARPIGAGINGNFQVEQATIAIASITSNVNNTEPAYLMLGKSRGTAIGSSTVVNSGDRLGEIRFAGADGTDMLSYGASIQAAVDGTPGTDDMPGRLVFSTTADGAASPTERIRITSAGVLQIADAGNITVGTTTGTKIGTATTQKLGFYNATPVVQPAAVANATTAVDVITQLNDLLAKLRTLGIIAT